MESNVTAEIRAAIHDGRHDDAIEKLRVLLSEVTGREISGVRINFDKYSLNSVNGFVDTRDGEEYFFKFHQEDGEEAGVEEYYNARVLKQAGYPVAQPVFQETTPGRQVMLYARVADPRFSDVCSAIEKGEKQYDFHSAVPVQTATDRAFAKIALATLETSENPAAMRQPIFQLFYNRLVDRPEKHTDQELGGRVAKFYLGETVDWPGVSGSFRDIQALGWRINGIDYPWTLRDCFERCLKKLSPINFLPGPVVTAHGDAHNANVWFHPGSKNSDAILSLFDPAFAGGEIPALLAEVKATFHNIFAHPFWLYEPDIFQEKYRISAHIADGRVCVETDYDLSPLREAFLLSKACGFWKPLLTGMKRRGQLPDDWEETVRMALFACPTLVMKLLPGEGSTHNPASSLMGFCQAVRAAGTPSGGEKDMFVRFFDEVRGA